MPDSHIDNDTSDGMRHSTDPFLVSTEPPMMSASVTMTLSTVTFSADALHRRNMKRMAIMTPLLVYIALLVLCGLLGNAIVFLVYYKKFNTNPTRTYILAMSVCDLLTNVLALVAEFTDAYFWVTFYSDWACKLLKTVMSILALFSGFVLLSVALERQTVVCCQYAKRQRQEKKARVVLFICCALAVGFSVPRALLFGGNPWNVGAICNTLDLYWDTPFPLVYNLSLGAVFVLTFIILSVCYLRIGLHLWRHNQRTKRGRQKADSGLKMEDRANDNSNDSGNNTDTNANASNNRLVPTSNQTFTSSSPQRSSSAGNTKSQTTLKCEHGSRRLEETGEKHTSSMKSRGLGKQIPNRTTLMLFVLTVVFVLNYLPYLVAEVLLFVGKEDAISNLNLLYFLLRSFYLNSAVNPFVYSFCSARFRYECRQLVCRA